MRSFLRRDLALAAFGVLVTCCGGEPAAVYRVAGETVDLTSGEAEVPIPGLSGASARTLYHVVAEQRGDLDGDGVEDRAVVIAVDPGGSGTFLHAAVRLAEPGSAAPIESVLLGDRLEVEDLRILPPGHVDAGMIIVGLNVRSPDAPMSEKPRFYVTRMLRVESGRLVEIPQY